MDLKERLLALKHRRSRPSVHSQRHGATFEPRRLLRSAGVLWICLAGMMPCRAVDISSIQWLAYAASGNPSLTSNPNAGGGLRIFPGAVSASDSDVSERPKATLRIQTSEPWELIHVRLFDVDDPSSDISPVDTTPGAGPDNRGGNPGFGFYISGLPPDQLAQTDGNRTVDLTVVVPTFAGDNVVAVARASETNGGIPDPVLATELANLEAYLWNSQGPTPPLHTSDISPMLTVWRKLHVERDAMASVPVDGPPQISNRFYGSQTVTTQLMYIPPNVYTRVNIGIGIGEYPTYGAWWGEDGQFEGGRFLTADGDDAAVSTSWEHVGSSEEVDLEGDYTHLGAETFMLIDDDEQESVGLADLTLATQLLADCYIDVVTESSQETTGLDVLQNLDGLTLLKNRPVRAPFCDRKGRRSSERGWYF